MPDFVLAIDQGTTGSTVALMDDRGRLRAAVNNEFPQIYPQPGWVEHHPADIWDSVLKGIRSILRKKQPAGIFPADCLPKVLQKGPADG